MAYAIMRTAKVKSTTSIVSMGKHNERKADTPNADRDRENVVLIGESEKTYLQYFEEATKDIKIRKDNVLAIECFMSVSPEFQFESSRQLKQWVDDSIRWASEEFGKENIAKAHLHMDETTPHIHAFIIPIRTDEKGKQKLNAKFYIGGTKYRMSELQTTYHKAVKKHGLERGIEGSKAKHQDVRKYYSALNKEVKKELPKTKVLESKDKYRDRVNKEYTKAVMQNLDKDLKIKRLQEQVPKKEKLKNLDNLINKKKNEIDDYKILKYLNKNPDVKKQIIQLIKPSKSKDITKNKNIDKSR